MDIEKIIPKNINNRALDEIMLIEPKNITFGRRDYDAIQENVITCLSDAVQNHVSNKTLLQTDLFNQPYIRIVADEAGGDKHKKRLMKSIKDLFKKPFEMRWVHPNTHKTIDTTGVLVTSLHDVKGTNLIELTINIWAIPFLLYYGKGVGGTRFNKYLALHIKGKYSKRIYKVLSANRDKTEFFYDIEQFRKDFAIPDYCENTHIKRKILEKSKQELNDVNSDVRFNFELICKHPKKGRKPKADTIVFKIHTLHPREAGGEQYEQYSFVYRWVSNAMGHPTNNRAVSAVDKITELGKLKTVYDRCVYYDDRVCSGEQTRSHAENALLKMLREEFKIK